MDLKEIHENVEVVRDKLWLKSQILGIKMLKPEMTVPKSAKSPIKDFGFHMDLCQAFHLSRWDGQTIIMTIEDMWCFEPVVGLGFTEPAEEFTKG